MFRLRSYVKEYEMRESVDNRGNVKKVPVYIGPWFIPTAEEEMRQRLKRIYAVMGNRERRASVMAIPARKS